MELSVWTYEGPPHVGAMRIATAMKGVHFVLHAPQGDTYADLLFTMIERRRARPPVTYTTFQARDLGGDTAELLKQTARDAFDRFSPELVLIGASCTAELIQDDPAGIGAALGLPVPVVPVELNAYQRKENWGASETFYRIARACCGRIEKVEKTEKVTDSKPRPSCNVLGPTALGFRHRDDLIEITRLLGRLGIDINVVAPLDASPSDLARLAAADFNVVLYPEIAETTARWLQKAFGQPFTTTVPMGVGATRAFVREVAELVGVDPSATLDEPSLRLPWYSRSIDSTYLTAKRVFIYGDATHAIASARIASEELGFEVVGLGTYSREQARAVRAEAKRYDLTALITEDHLTVEEAIAEARPELVLGTQMERHISKRLGLPCAVISAPVHVHDYPARYSPLMGFEGANVIFDTWVHPLMMGLEEHLLGMFRDDFEFADGAAPSHLGHVGGPVEDASIVHTSVANQDLAHGATEPELSLVKNPTRVPSSAAPGATPEWTTEAAKELKKIPFFVRGKARRNTEQFARERSYQPITLETLYEAKAHFQGR